MACRSPAVRRARCSAQPMGRRFKSRNPSLCVFRLTQIVRKSAVCSGHAPTSSSSKFCNHCYMKILNLIHVMVAQAFYRWAMREINPMHPDLPRIMQRQQELADKAQRMFRVRSFSR